MGCNREDEEPNRHKKARICLLAGGAKKRMAKKSWKAEMRGNLTEKKRR